MASKDNALRRVYKALMSYETFGLIQNVDLLKREILIALNSSDIDSKQFSDDIIMDSALETARILENLRKGETF
jgi:hypothetical protein